MWVKSRETRHKCGAALRVTIPCSTRELQVSLPSKNAGSHMATVNCSVADVFLVWAWSAPRSCAAFAAITAISLAAASTSTSIAAT